MIRVGGKIVVNKITLLLNYHGTVIVFMNTVHFCVYLLNYPIYDSCWRQVLNPLKLVLRVLKDDCRLNSPFFLGLSGVLIDKMMLKTQIPDWR